MQHCLLNKNPPLVYFQLILVRTRERIVRPKIDIMQVHLFLKRDLLRCCKHIHLFPAYVNIDVLFIVFHCGIGKLQNCAECQF